MNLESPIERLRVELDARGYDILIGPRLIARAGREIRPLMRGRQAVIVTDEIVARHQLAPLQASLSDADIAHHSVVLPPGDVQAAATRAIAMQKEEKEVTFKRIDAGEKIGDISGATQLILSRLAP